MKLLSVLATLFFTMVVQAQNLVSGSNPNFIIDNIKQQGNESDYGYNNMVIARWVTPQYQTINKPTKVGLLAYHFSDINHVQFYLNGGPVIKVFNKTWNEGIFGYWIQISPIPDSEYNRLVAVIVPNSGTPFILQGDPRYNPNFLPGGTDAYGNEFGQTRIAGVESLQFASDFSGTLRKVNVYVDSINGNNNNSGLVPNQAKKTVFAAVLAARDVNNMVDGAIVNFMSGDYIFGDSYYVGSVYPRNFYRPVMFQPYGDASVRIIEGSGTGKLGLNSYHIKNMIIARSAQEITANGIVFLGTPNYGTPVTYIGSEPPTDTEYVNAGKFVYTLVENCFMDNLVETSQNMYFVGYNGSSSYRSRTDYVGCHVQNVWNAYTNGELVKNCSAYNVHSDMVDGGSCIVGLRFERFGKYVSSTAHPDLLQWYRSDANTIMYNVKCDDALIAENCPTQGVFNNPAGGGVVLNVAIDRLKWQGTYVRQLSIASSHNILIRNSNIGGSWIDGCKVIPQFDTGENFLMQGVTRNTYNPTTGVISNYGSPVYGHHVAPWNAAGSPRRGIWEYNGTRYYFSYIEMDQADLQEYNSLPLYK
jgi:hypothetical protein